MKNASQFRLALIVLAALAAPLMSFTLRGGDSFEIYLGKTLAVQQFLHMDKAVKTINLAAARSTDDIKVSFSHCGVTATNRTLALKDNRTVLKTWTFANVKTGGSAAMTIPVNDIAVIQKNQHGKSLALFYTSDLMKDGVVLATLAAESPQVRAK